MSSWPNCFFRNYGDSIRIYINNYKNNFIKRTRIFLIIQNDKKFGNQLSATNFFETIFFKQKVSYPLRKDNNRTLQTILPATKNKK